MRRQAQAERGFTLVEALVTMALLTSVFALIFVNLGKPQTVASLHGAVETLVADLRTQQMLAMNGNSAGSSTQQSHGVFVSADTYTVFSGNSYNVSDSNNYVVTPGRDITLSTNFPGEQIVFDENSGEVVGYSESNNTIVITGDEGSKTLTINRFGVVTVE